MPLSNFERMIQMAEEVFDAHNDTQQLQIDENILAQLQRLHESCVIQSEKLIR